MSDDIHRKRAALESMYNSSSVWRNKVRGMSDAQVVAIYLKEEAKGTFDKKFPKPKEENDDEIPF